MQQYFMPIYTTVVGLVIGLLAGAVRNLVTKAKNDKTKKDDTDEALKEGIAILLKKQLFDYYIEYEHRDSIPASEWEEIETTHKVYNRLGGNHTGDRIFRAMEEKHIAGEIHGKS